MGAAVMIIILPELFCLFNGLITTHFAQLNCTAFLTGMLNAS